VCGLLVWCCGALFVGWCASGFGALWVGVSGVWECGACVETQLACLWVACLCFW